MSEYAFAFGTPLTETGPAKPDSLPAHAFVIGVYPSAVHARWDGPDKVGCAALAVAPEPYSFWDGADAEERVRGIAVPTNAGRLTAAGSGINGPSGGVLLRRYLAPLGLDSKRCWITDLHSSYYLSDGNRAALARYMEFRSDKCPELPAADLPERPPTVVPDAGRLADLRREFETASPRWVITLGSEPVSVLLGHDAQLKLSEYGHPERATIWGADVLLLRLCHPRQAGGLGSHSPKWKKAHDDWVDRVQAAGGISGLEKLLKMNRAAPIAARPSK